MRAGFFHLRRPTGKLQPRQQAPALRPRVEELEDRHLLQGGPLTAEGFVTQLYRDVLKREPDQGGLTAWAGLLDSGHGQSSKPQQDSLALVAQGFLNSIEFHTDVVQGFYNTFLHRAADPSGLNGWTNFLNQGGIQRQLEAWFLGSDEYYVTRGGGTVSGYLQAVYQDVLNRQIDPAGLQLDTAWLSGNNTAASRTELASEVINSPEGNTVAIDHLYSQFLHRAPDPGGLSGFLAAFQANQNASGSGSPGPESGNNVSGSPNTSEDPPQASIIPAILRNNGSNGNGGNPGPASGITLEQAMVVVLSSPEYFAQADR